MMSLVQDTLAAWREAERRLKATDDPREILALLAEVKSLQEAHRRAVDLSGHDVSAHGEPTEDPSGRLRLDAVGYSQTMLSIIGWTAAISVSKSFGL